MNDNHVMMMKRALVLARRGVGKTAPNPAVGCVIVTGNRIVGEGWHRKAGTPHAEVHALREAGENARGADLYVTLEPCSHFGKTPPCADAIIAAGVRQVYVAMVDPNTLVSGNGIERLRQAGIEVVVGILEEESRRINEPFIKHISTGLPFVVLKSALTLDGKTATATGDSRWITSDASRRYVHRLRSRMDAIMVGVGTVIADDPQLTARIPGGRDPIRIIVDSTLRIPMHAQVLNLTSSAPTIVATVAKDSPKAEKLRELGVEILTCKERDGKVDLADLLAKVGRRGIQSILLEGGRELAGEAHRLNLIDKYSLFLAPKILGGDGYGVFAGTGAVRMADVFRLREVTVRRISVDLLVEGYPEVTCSPV